MKRFVYIVGLICLLVACSERREYTGALSRAVAVVSDHPDSALAILDSLGREESHFSRHFRMQYRLYRLNALNKTDTLFRSTDEAQELADYFDRQGTPNEQMLAYYLLGRAYYDIHEAPMALHSYHTAAEKADTAAPDCDFAQLSRVYGQLGDVFYDQNLAEEDLKYTDLSIKYAWRAKDTLCALLSMAEKSLIFGRMSQIDSALMVNEQTSRLFRRYGYRRHAAGVLASTIMHLIDKGQIAEAKRNIDIYESESGFFDDKGNIEKGREVYYHSKGQYYLAIGRFDSAEYYFRKELREGKDFNNQNAGSRGLALLFQKTNRPDSAAKYALYSYAMNDSVYSRMATSEIERMSSLYDYTRNEEIAQRERERAETERRNKLYIALLLVALAGGGAMVIRNEMRKRKAGLRKYHEAVLLLARHQAEIVKLRSHETTLGQLIAEKEKTIEQLNDSIQGYREKIGLHKISAIAERLLQESATYQELQGLAARAAVLTDEHWQQVHVMLIEIFPGFYQFISSNKWKLKEKEIETCLLIRLHFGPKDISNMLGVTQAYVTKMRNGMMLKLFGVDGTSKELDERLLSLV